MPSAPIYTLDEALEDPQVKHLGMVTELPHPKLGTIKLLTGAVNLSDTPMAVTSLAPRHGQHTQEILARIAHRIKPGGTGEAAQ